MQVRTSPFAPVNTKGSPLPNSPVMRPSAWRTRWSGSVLTDPSPVCLPGLGRVADDRVEPRWLAGEREPERGRSLAGDLEGFDLGSGFALPRGHREREEGHRGEDRIAGHGAVSGRGQ